MHVHPLISSTSTVHSQLSKTHPPVYNIAKLIRLSNTNTTTMAGLPPGVVTFGPDVTCTLDTCPVEWSIYTYRPSLPANIALLAVFGAIAFVHVILGIRWRAWGFMGGMIFGCVAEIAGYIGRIMLYDDPFSWVGFMIQISASPFLFPHPFTPQGNLLTLCLPSLFDHCPRLLHGIHLRHPVQDDPLPRP